MIQSKLKQYGHKYLVSKFAKTFDKPQFKDINYYLYINKKNNKKKSALNLFCLPVRSSKKGGFNLDFNLDFNEIF